MRYATQPDGETDNALSVESIDEPQPDPMISDSQADAIVASIVFWIMDGRSNGRSLVAAIICDAVAADASLRPLHSAYDRRRREW